MPATDNSAVQITINVVDGATGETISRVTKSLDSLGDAGARNGQKLKQGMTEAGRAGESVGPAVGKGMKEAGAHSLSALDNVRLLRDDLGIRIPRAMENVIARSGALSAAIGAVGTGLVALGAIEIFVRLASEAYQFYKRVSDVNAEMRKFAEEAGKNANSKLFDTASIEEVNALLKQTEDTMTRLDKKRVTAGVGQDNSGSIAQYFNKYVLGGAFAQPTYNAQDDKQRADAAHNAQLLNERKRMLDAKRAVDLQEAKATEDGERLKGTAAINAAKENAITLALLTETQDRRAAYYQRDLVIESNRLIRAQNPDASAEDLRKKGLSDVPVLAANMGEQERKDAIARASGQADAKLGRQGQDNTRETRHIVAEAGIANLDGEPQFIAKKMEALEQLRDKATELGLSQRDYQARAKAIDDAFYQAQSKRMLEEDARSAELESRANVGGRTGLAKLDAERAAALKKQQDDAATGKFTNVDTLGRNTTAINKQYENEGSQQQTGFTERLEQLDAGRSDRYASESDRITQSAQKTVREIQKAWGDLYGGLAVGDARRVQSQQALNDEITKINADAARQRQEAGQRVEDETAKLEDQARRQGLPKYQQETAAIVDDYNERIQKLEELRSKDAANADRYRRQELAEEQIKNGKLLEQRRALQDQLAGKIASLASNPLEFLKRQGAEAGSKFAAQELFKLFPNVSTAIATGGKGGGGLPSIFGSGFGGKHPATFDHGASQAGSGTHNDNPLPATLTKPQIASDTTMLTTSTATINVGTATFNGVAGSQNAGGAQRGGSGSYVPLGNGGYFNVGSGSGGGATGDAGLSGGSSSSSGVSAPAPWTEAGTSAPGASVNAPGAWTDAGASGGGVGSRIGGGIGAAQSAGSAVQDIGKSLGKGNVIGSLASKVGISGETLGKLGGAVGGGLGIFSAIEGSGGVGGALSGAVSGAQIGAIFGGPLGAGIGAAAGALLGVFGFGARAKAAKYDRTKVRPRIANDLIAYEAGQGDYQSTYDDMNSLSLEAKQELKSYGSGASGYYNDHILPEIKTAQQRLTREAKAGRAEFGMSAAQFHLGGIIRDFGSMATAGDQGWVHAQRGEAILNQQAAMTHADAAMLMNSGASRSQMAEYYGGGSGTRAAEASDGRDVHFNVSAIDARGVQQFFDDHGHKIRAALNKSYENNSGGGDYA